MIQAIDVCKSFDGRLVLDNISAQFEPGKTNLIIGQSGSGKTVLLKSLVGLHQIDSGRIMYGDICFNQSSLKEKRQIRQEMGMIFQGGALLDASTVEENVRFPLDLFTDMSTKEKKERVEFCLCRVNIQDANTKFPSELSGGMVKRVAIARAIVMNPKYLFCDEPNSGLDPKTSVMIDNLIKEITEEYNITTIVNTHDMNSVMEIGDTIIFIHHGKKWWQGTKDDILHSDNKELERFVFASAMAKKVKSATCVQHINATDVGK
ncbi:Methionine ABC transporter ATP-binding protein [Mucinivorans hirudinis]|uniref:Methionine ABC transporter ATP-binding protein n=1 Tax=Mucinivorans hirudinis TaxID=1433126 RepID=A0A060RDF3_9BACT|nr:Methionine ABC transporter ATP-binding protein [Mucinivorans hirudinis]